jgi:hypothetical protein
MKQFVAHVCSARSVLSQFPLRCQKTAVAMMMAPAVNQFTRIPSGAIWESDRIRAGSRRNATEIAEAEASASQGKETSQIAYRQIALIFCCANRFLADFSSVIFSTFIAQLRPGGGCDLQHFRRFIKIAP